MLHSVAWADGLVPQVVGGRGGVDAPVEEIFKFLKHINLFYNI